jgi:hypothetical protein
MLQNYPSRPQKHHRSSTITTTPRPKLQLLPSFNFQPILLLLLHTAAPLKTSSTSRKNSPPISLCNNVYVLGTKDDNQNRNPKTPPEHDPDVTHFLRSHGDEFRTFFLFLFFGTGLNNLRDCICSVAGQSIDRSIDDRERKRSLKKQTKHSHETRESGKGTQ